MEWSLDGPLWPCYMITWWTIELSCFNSKTLNNFNSIVSTKNQTMYTLYLIFKLKNIFWSILYRYILLMKMYLKYITSISLLSKNWIIGRAFSWSETHHTENTMYRFVPNSWFSYAIMFVSKNFGLLCWYLFFLTN